MEMPIILVPTDFSTYAVHAMQEALAIAARDKAQVLLLHVLPVLTLAWPDSVAPRTAARAWHTSLLAVWRSAWCAMRLARSSLCGPFRHTSRRPRGGPHGSWMV